MKTFIKIIVILIVLFGIIYFGANYALKKVAVKTVEILRPRLEQRGIDIDSFSYDKVRLSAINKCRISDISLDFHMNKAMFGKNSYKATFRAEALILRLGSLKTPSVFLELKDFSLYIEPEDKGAKRQFGRLENATISGRMPVYLKNPEESAKEVLAEVKQLFRDSRSPLDITLATSVFLGIDDRELQVRMLTERIADTTYLRFNPEDILAAALQLDMDLAPLEAEVIAKHPGKSLAMIKITRDAKRVSVHEKSQDPSFPEDAYRHIYWSYHLTREFGQELAKEITDAHETAIGNTREEHLMDYHNNEVGRRYAERVMSVQELKGLVLSSPEIIRNPSEVR